MEETDTDLAAKLLSILNDETESASAIDSIMKSADGQDEELTEDQRATLQSLLDAGMDSPEQIIQRAKCAEHNAMIEVQRKADLAARQERRAKGLKPKRQKR